MVKTKKCRKGSAPKTKNVIMNNMENDLDYYEILQLNESIVAENEREWRKVQMLVKSIKRIKKIKKIFKELYYNS